jgi:hypothetical protein
MTGDSSRLPLREEAALDRQTLEISLPENSFRGGKLPGSPDIVG